jgi:hypothetical protein
VTGQPTPTRGALRVLRGCALAVTSATLAVAAHALSGGELPDPALTALLTVGVAAAGIALADRRRSPGAILALLGAAQLATHVMLSFAGMQMAGTSVPVPHVNGFVMLGAHAVAVLVSAGLLARADAVVFLLAAVVSMLLPRMLVAPPVPDWPTGTRPDVLPQVRTIAVLLCRSHARRGPPVAA